MKVKTATGRPRESAAPHAGGKGTVSSKGQITIPKSVRDRYAFTPGAELEFEFRDEGALLRRKRPGRHPAWDLIGSFRESWPRGLPRDVDTYIDLVRGPYTAPRPPSRRRSRGR